MNIKSVISLEDKMSPTLSKIQRQSLQQIQTFEKMSRSVDSYKKSLEAVEKSNPNIVNTQMYMNASDAVRRYEDSLYDAANGQGSLKLATEGTTGAIGRQITKFLTWTAIIAGVKKLINLSDTYTQTNARIDMMNDGLQTTAELQDYIYRSAQRSRVSYQSMADTVAKLGNQAGEAFGNNSKQIVQFTELLNKAFTVSGLDTTSIDSVMYNLTQSLSSGKLLGQDYRILKQNAPQILQYLRQFYGDISQAELDALVTAGRVSAQDLKNAMFKAANDINNKFEKMPVTFNQVWTKFKNVGQKALQPVLRILSKVADWLEKIVDFLDKNMYILYILAAALGALAIEHIILSGAITGATIAQGGLNSAMLACPATWIILAIAAIAAALIYLWNTNDDVAWGMIYAWDVMRIAAGVAVSGIKAIWLGLVTVVGGVLSFILSAVNLIVDALIGVVNVGIDAVNAFGANKEKIAYPQFAKNFNDAYGKTVVSLSEDLSDYWGESVLDKAAELNATRDERTQNRKKLTKESLLEGMDYNGISNAIEDVTGTDGNGGKALKTTTDDDLLSDEDIKLLLDVATRDYKLNYQQVTPNITITFGDVRETADVDDILDQVADKLEEIYDSNLEVEPA